MAKALPAELATFIRMHYATNTTQWISEQTGKTPNQIKAWANSKGLTKTPAWSREDIELLKREYERGDLELVVATTGKRRKTIREYARRIGLKRKSQGNRFGTLRPLLDGSLQSFYWLGFYAADGYVSRGGHFQCSQSEKDRERIESLATFLKARVYEFIKIGGFTGKPRKHFRVAIQDKELGVQLRDLFGTIDKKTYEGVSLRFLRGSRRNAIAFLIGFIDGDGHMKFKSDVAMCVCHHSWTATFHDLIAVLPITIAKNCRVSDWIQHKTGKIYSALTVKTFAVRKLRRWIKRNGLDCSKRKWPEVHDKLPAAMSA